MNIYSVICSRKDNPPPTIDHIRNFFPQGTLSIQLDKDSIFAGYNDGIKELDERFTLQDDDIIIFSHDDIEYITSYPELVKILKYSFLMLPEIGFAGVAGTKLLTEDAVWWNHLNWNQGFHRGFIFHGTSMFDAKPTVYTPPGKELDRQVLVLDGVFLACQYKTIKKMGGWSKPAEFKGNWDFYDIYTTWKANRYGLRNYAIPIIIRHLSFGSLAGRQGWDENRKEFMSVASLPVEIV